MLTYDFATASRKKGGDGELVSVKGEYYERLRGYKFSPAGAGGAFKYRYATKIYPH